jgi:hypothetical protein
MFDPRALAEHKAFMESIRHKPTIKMTGGSTSVLFNQLL